ncbi:MAG TPA: AarF/UbiB family protein [Cryobacterium sp.]|nr:AarF/UbiB family protein [Cryobacterium sp.]
MTDVGNLRARSRRILRFAALYLAQAWWYELVLPRIGLARVAARNRPARLQHIAKRFHVLAVDLGGLMIKVGQFMSSRLDVLPPEITKELEGLQDEVPPVPFPSIRALAEAELGVSLERAFSFVDPTPLAAASLGQVHRARLSREDAAETGLLDVVVKVQRPGISAIVDVDLSALRRVARWLSHVRLVSDRVDMPALVEEFAVTSLEEIDYLQEAASAERFAQIFADDPRVSVPELVWERTTRRVLTLQDVTAIKINDVDGLRAAGIDPSEVADDFASVMFDQLFVHGYFHADPHPGNIFVTPLAAGQSRNWKFTFIDFGMMGEVPDALRQGLIKLLIAAAARDGKGMVDGIRAVGVLLPSADTAELERAMTKLFARFGGMGFAELQDVDPREFRAFALEFGDVVRSLPFQLPENFLLIVRAMSLTSGMCSSLDPAFNIWNSVEPYSAQLIRAEGGNVVQAAAKQAVSVAGIIARLPQRLDNLTTRFDEGTVSVQTPRIERRLVGLERTGRQVISAILFAALLIGGILLRADDVVLGTVLLAVSALPLLHALFAGVLARRGP